MILSLTSYCMDSGFEKSREQVRKIKAFWMDLEVKAGMLTAHCTFPSAKAKFKGQVSGAIPLGRPLPVLLEPSSYRSPST